MSLSITDAYLARHRSAIHPLIAVTVPFMFLICIDPAIRALLPAVEFPHPLFLAVLLLIGIETTVMGNVFLDERAGFVARIQELAAVLVAAWALLAAVTSFRLRAFTPLHPAYIYPLLLVLYQWTVTMAIHMHLRERELLLAVLIGREGDALLHTLRDSSLQASMSLKSLRAAVVLASAQQGIAFILFAAASALNAPIGAGGYILCVTHAIFGFAAIGLLKVFSENQLLLGEGVVVSGRMEGRRLIASWAIVACAVPAAVLASRDSSLLPFSLLLDLLRRLSQFLTFHFGEGAARWIQQLLLSRSLSTDQLNDLASGGGMDPSILLMGEALRRLLVAGIVITLYFFIVSPLLSEEFLAALGKRSPLSFLLRKLRDFMEFWKRMGERFREWLLWRGRGYRRRLYVTTGARIGAHDPAMRGNLSLRKRIQLGRLMKAFLQLLKWAERRGVSYRGHETLQEYSTRLLPVIPDRSPEISFIVDVLEEGLFSTHIVSADRMSRYFSAIKGIRTAA
jgi:hypothetical protein